MKKTIEEKYKTMDEISHILSRSGMYVGSTKEEECQRYVFDDEESKMTIKNVSIVPAMLKIFDEVLSNSCDEYRRKDNMGINQIDVKIYKSGKIVVRDNGGIPIVKHKEAGCYLPEFIFGRLRTSSNYDDTDDRQLIGTNGIGVKIANIFSKDFEVESADGKNKICVSWKDNMRNVVSHGTPTKTKEHYTQTTINIDFDKFDINENEYTDDFISVVQKRCLDASAANIGITVTFEYYENDKKPSISNKWKFKSFEQYIELFSDFIETDNGISFADKNNKVWVYPDGNINVGFVDGAECSRGTHIRGIRTPINQAVADYIVSKKKLDVKPQNVDSKYSLFCLVNVSNPAYDSQTKECLTTPIDKFYKDSKDKFVVPNNFIDDCVKSEIVNDVIDWFKQKQEADDAKAIRKLNREGKKLLRSDKFIDCNSKKVQEKQLWLFEGDSAKSGFRISRDPNTQAAYLLRGCPKNCLGLSPTQVMKNSEFSDIFNILGLQWGDKMKLSDLKFGKIIICSDMDADGSKIASLMLVFFNNFPELFEHGLIMRSISPIIIASKGKDTKKYYTLTDFRKEQKSLKGYNIRYIKGLGGMQNADYKEMMREPIFHVFKKDEIADKMLNKWFKKDGAEERRTMLKKDVE